MARRRSLRTIVGLLISLLSGVASNADADGLTISHESDTAIIINGNTITIGGQSRPGEAPMVGNGKIIRDQRSIEAVTAVSLEGAFLVTIDVGSDPTLILEGDENILSVIRTESAGDRLRIYADRSYSAKKPIKVTLSLPTLARLSAEGSNSIAARGIAARQLAVTMSGSNSVTVSGRADALSATLAGSGQLAATDLEADRATIKISGAGSGAVTAHSEFVAEIDGSGAIEVHGHPSERAVHVNGSGSVQYAD